MTALDAAFAGTRDVIFGEQDAAASFVDETCEDVQQLWEIERAAGSIRSAAWRIQEATRTSLIKALRGDALRIENYLLRAVPEPPRRVFLDEDRLFAYLGVTAGALLALPKQHLSVHGVRQFARINGDDPDEIEQRFFGWEGEDGPPSLWITPMEKAPYWALHLKPGERMPQPPPPWRAEIAKAGVR